MDLFVVPTISFRLLVGLLIKGARPTTNFVVWRHKEDHCRMDRKSGHGNTAVGNGSRYLIRDRDGAYGEVFIRRLRSMGIRDRPTSPRSPWQNGYAERLIVRSDGNASTSLLCSASDTSVIYCCRT